MKTLYNQQYSSEFAEKCRNALEANFGEIPMPKNIVNRKENVRITKNVGIMKENDEVEPIFIFELHQKPKHKNKRRINKNNNGKNNKKRKFLIKIKTKQIKKNTKSSNFF